VGLTAPSAQKQRNSVQEQQPAKKWQGALEQLLKTISIAEEY
jgi:hypothetical protein